MKHFKVKYKNSLSNPNSNYYKRFGGILTKLITCKNKSEITENYKNIIEITEL